MKKFVHLNLALVTALVCGCQSTIPANQKYESGVWGRVMVDGKTQLTWKSGNFRSSGSESKDFVRRGDARTQAALCLLDATQKGIQPGTQIEIHIPGNFLGTTLRYSVQSDDKNRCLVQDGKQRVIDPVSNTIEHYRELCQKEVEKDIDAVIE